MVDAVATLRGHKNQVWSLAWSPDGKTLASCGSDKDIRFWGHNGYEWQCKSILFSEHQRTVRCVTWSPSGMYLTTASFDSSVNVWRRESDGFVLSTSLDGHDNEVKCAAWSASEAYLATCGRDRSVWIWEKVEEEEFECVAILSAHSQDVKKVVWHPQQDVLASCSYDNLIKLFIEDDGDWIVCCSLQSHLSTVWSICFNREGSRLASSSDDETVKIWQNFGASNQYDFKCVCTLTGFHKQPVYDIAWCHHTDLIATACGDNNLRIFKECIGNQSSAPCYDLLYTVHSAHKQDINAVSWNPLNHGLMASAGDDGVISIWQVNEDS